MANVASKVICSVCKESFEYEDDGVTTDCMPDGVLVHGGPEWVCDECMRDENDNILPEYD